MKWHRLLPFLVVLSLNSTCAQAQNKGKLIGKFAWNSGATSGSEFSTPSNDPRKLNSIYFEDARISARVLAVTPQNTFLISEPLQDRHSILREFDSQLRPIHNFSGEWDKDTEVVGAARAGDLMWCILSSASDPTRKVGVNLLAVECKTNKLGRDWRQGFPDAVQDYLRQMFREKKLVWSAKGWVVSKATYSGGKLLLRLSNPLLGTVDNISRSSWILLDGKGQKVLAGRINDPLDGLPIIDVSGKLNFLVAEAKNPKVFRWQRLGIQRSSGKTTWFHARGAKKSAWMQQVEGGDFWPSVQIDARNHFYFSTSPFDNVPPNDLVVGDKMQFLASFPWPPADKRSGTPQIFPAPDGRGFYRVLYGYGENGLSIYYYPLPK